MRGLVAVQSLVRCYLARRQLKKLKIEAKSIEHQKKLNKGLENKIISLQHKLNEMVSPGSRQGGSESCCVQRAEGLTTPVSVAG